MVDNIEKITEKEEEEIVNTKSESQELSLVLDALPLDASNNDLARKLISEENLDVIKDITKKFSINQTKKNVLRIIKLNNLLDKVNDQAIERFEKKPGDINTTDLIKYMQVVQDSIDKSQKYIENIDTSPMIQLNRQENTVNINVGSELDRESKEKVIEAINALLVQAKTTDKTTEESNTIEVETINDEKEGN